MHNCWRYTWSVFWSIRDVPCCRKDSGCELCVSWWLCRSRLPQRWSCFIINDLKSAISPSCNTVAWEPRKQSNYTNVSSPSATLSLFLLYLSFSSYGFYDECVKKYGSADIWTRFTELFNYLPIGAIVQNEVLSSFFPERSLLLILVHGRSWWTFPHCSYCWWYSQNRPHPRNPTRRFNGFPVAFLYLLQFIPTILLFLLFELIRRIFRRQTIRFPSKVWFTHHRHHVHHRSSLFIVHVVQVIRSVVMLQRDFFRRMASDSSFVRISSSQMASTSRMNGNAPHSSLRQTTATDVLTKEQLWR